MSKPFVEDFAIERYRKGGSANYFTQGLGATAAATLALTANRLYGCPFFVPKTEKFDLVAVNVTTKGTAAADRLGIYADLGTIAPGRLIRDFNTIDASATGVKTIDITATPLELMGGQLYWLAIVTGVANTLRATAVGTNLTCFFGLNNSLNTAWSTFVYIAFNYAALPDPFGAEVTIATGNMPAVFLRKV